MPAEPLPLFNPIPPDARLTPAPRGWPVLRLGFRPFYLGAAMLALFSLPLWLVLHLGVVSLNLLVPPMLWHAHEMLFGFAAAVIVGFLMTAGRNWTGLATPRGASLGALAALWLAARIAALAAPYPVYMLLDLLLLPLVAANLVTLLLRARNHRNLPLAAILVLLSLANLAFHVSVIGWVDLPPLHALHAGLALIVMIECVMAGRVVPAFTMGATPGLDIASRPMLERAVLSVSALALALWVFAPPGALTGAAFAAAALLHALRQWHWQPWLTRTRPILWILHAAYGWIAVGFALLALAQFGALSVSAGVHALAVGATGGLIIGMITRTARGHTGRPIRASRLEVAAYALVMAAAVLRVLVPLVLPAWWLPALIGAALAWCLAFALYLLVFSPWLTSTRLDGKDG